jgi:glycosyl hydrolase family 26
VLVTSVVLAFRSSTPPRSVPRLGLYAGPGARGVAAANDFERTTKAPLGQLLDFGSADDWAGVTGPTWLLDPHKTSGLRLEYSLPTFPHDKGNSLVDCADGRYDGHWTQLASNLVAAGLATTIVRPGWEFNGDWYDWSAKDQVTQYVGCFRQIVNTMRATSGARFQFDWNPNLGTGKLPAEQAYPGDAYVDYVGVDAYDTSSWNKLYRGDHGLRFWSRFAGRHHKPLAIPEWGVVGGGGGRGDDPSYIDHMVSFMTDARNHVAYEQYFDVTSSVARHDIDPGTPFPQSRAAFLKWMRDLVD